MKQEKFRKLQLLLLLTGLLLLMLLVNSNEHFHRLRVQHPALAYPDRSQPLVEDGVPSVERVQSRVRRALIAVPVFDEPGIVVNFSTESSLHKTSDGLEPVRMIVQARIQGPEVNFQFNVTSAFWRAVTNSSGSSIGPRNTSTVVVPERAELNGSVILSKVEIESLPKETILTYDIQLFNLSDVLEQYSFVPEFTVNMTTSVQAPFAFTVELMPKAGSTSLGSTARLSSDGITASTHGAGGGSGGTTESTLSNTTTPLVTTVPAPTTSVLDGLTNATSSSNSSTSDVTTPLADSGLTITSTSSNGNSIGSNPGQRRESNSDSNLATILGASVPSAFIALLALAGYTYYKQRHTGISAIPRHPQARVHIHEHQPSPDGISIVSKPDKYAVYMGDDDDGFTEDIYSAASPNIVPDKSSASMPLRPLVALPQLPKRNSTFGKPDQLMVGNAIKSYVNTAAAADGDSDGKVNESFLAASEDDSVYADLPQVVGGEERKLDGGSAPPEDMDTSGSMLYEVDVSPVLTRNSAHYTENAESVLHGTGSTKRGPHKPARRNSYQYSSVSPKPPSASSKRHLSTSAVRPSEQAPRPASSAYEAAIASGIADSAGQASTKDTTQADIEDHNLISSPVPSLSASDIYDMPSKSSLCFQDANTTDLLDMSAAGTQLLSQGDPDIYDNSSDIVPALTMYPYGALPDTGQPTGTGTLNDRPPMVVPVTTGHYDSSVTPTRFDSIGYMAPRDYKKSLKANALIIPEAGGHSAMTVEDVLYDEALSRASCGAHESPMPMLGENTGRHLSASGTLYDTIMHGQSPRPDEAVPLKAITPPGQAVSAQGKKSKSKKLWKPKQGKSKKPKRKSKKQGSASDAHQDDEAHDDKLTGGTKHTLDGQVD